jgi:hypothetical protein
VVSQQGNDFAASISVLQFHDFVKHSSIFFAAVDIISQQNQGSVLLAQVACDDVQSVLKCEQTAVYIADAVVDHRVLLGFHGLWIPAKGRIRLGGSLFSKSRPNYA